MGQLPKRRSAFEAERLHNDWLGALPSTYGCRLGFAPALEESEQPEYNVTAHFAGKCDHACRLGLHSGGVSGFRA